VIAFRDQGTAPCEHVTGLLRRHAVEVGARIAELQQLTASWSGSRRGPRTWTPPSACRSTSAT
jgi:hypothetical protein